MAYSLTDKEAQQLYVLLQKLWEPFNAYDGGRIVPKTYLAVDPIVHKWVKTYAEAKNVKMQQVHALALRAGITLMLATEKELGFDPKIYVQNKIRHWLADHPESETR
jgi:hypothetical protein